MFELYFRSLLLGTGLAMDACAVSMANGLNEPKIIHKRILLIAFMFALFQALMPLIGYFLGHALLSYIEPFIPWLSLILLLLVGGKMLIEGIRNKDSNITNKELTFKVLLIQAIATSIDALSVGFTFCDYSIPDAIQSVLIIGVVTFGICYLAVHIGKKFGTRFDNKAEIIGGIILIIIGIEIFLKSII